MSIGKNNHHKEKGIKIIDPEKIDYTFTDKDDPFNIKSSLFINEKNIDSSSKSKTKKRILTGYGLISQRIQRLGLKEG